jgi:hypothetical protein
MRMFTPSHVLLVLLRARLLPQVTKVEKAVLSTTAKARERQKKKDAEKQKGEAAGKAAGACVEFVRLLRTT